MKVSQLSPGQRDQLLRRTRERQPVARPAPGIERRRDPDAPVPLSFAQQRLWFLDQLAPGNPAYNIPVAIQIAGPLRIDLLRKAFEELIKRHESLRTRFLSSGGQPFQVISQCEPGLLPIVDLADLSAGLEETVARDLCGREGMRSFDLAAGPLLRSTIFRLAEDRHILLLVLHHIISDLWSFAILIREVSLVYDALLNGRRSSLPELPIQYPDFAIWQREQLKGEALEQEIRHWREELQGAPLLLSLPIDRPRPAVLEYRGAWLPWILPAEPVENLRRLGFKDGATLFMTMLATFSALLSRYCSQEDLIIGSPVANRTRIEVEGLIGFFVNMLVLRADLTGRPSFHALLARITERCVRALNHQDLPFEQLVDSLGLDRDLSRPPLVQVALSLQNVALASTGRSELRFTPFDFKFELTKFDFAIELQENGNVLWGTLAYNSGLFEETTIRRIGLHYSALIEGLTTYPDRPVQELSLLTEAEQHALMREWSSPYCLKKGHLAALFRSTARRLPTAAAAVWDGGELSYGELLARSGRVAARLRSLGVGPEAVVGLILERSPDLLIGMMGVLAAGGACLLLAPDRERAWLERVLEHSGAFLVLTQGRLANRMPEHGAREALLEHLEEPRGLPDPFVEEQDAAPESLAFVIQTSGNRHSPLLLGLEHRSVAAWVRSWEQRLGPKHLAKVETASALETVDAVFDLVLPLCLGGCLALGKAPKAASLLSATPSQISARLRRPALWRGPRAVRSFGEPLGTALRQHLQAVGVARVFDSYSSARAGVWEWEERSGTLHGGGLGGEVTVYILDLAGSPVPIGVTGELFLSEGGAARGSMNDAEWTAALFIPDPFGGYAGRRLVRTGDLARWGWDGGLHIVTKGPDRLSSTSPAESFLSEYPGVLQAVTRAQPQERPGHGVAYVLTAGPTGPTEEELQAHLRAWLPESQIPRTLLLMEELPLTPAGRVDRENLPRVQEEVADQVAPRNEVERVLAAVWRELLQRDRIGVRENFFRLGGHSLLAVSLMSRIDSEFGVEVPLSVLFQAPTIAGLAEHIQTDAKTQWPSVLVSIQPHGERPPLFFAHPVGGSVFCYQELAQCLGPGQPFFGLQNEATSNPETLPEMASRYVTAVRAVQPEGPYFLGGWSLGAVIAFEMARQLWEAGATVALLAMVDAPPAQAQERGLDTVDEETWLIRFAIDLLGVQASTLSTLLPEALHLESEARLERLLELVQQQGILPLTFTLQNLRGRFELFRRNLQALSQYEARPLPGSLLFLSCRRDSAQEQRDPLRGWGKFALGGAEWHPLPGDHYSILQRPDVLALSEDLKAGIENSSRS